MHRLSFTFEASLKERVNFGLIFVLTTNNELLIIKTDKTAKQHF